MLTGCKGENGIISPITPDGNYESDRGHEYPDDSNHRTISESPSNASMIMTGPEEYLTSELSVKLITSARPVFSAKLTNVDGLITADNFRARIDHDQIRCTYNSGDSTVSFQPDEDLADGMHQASLFFVNPSGSTRMLHWSFRIRTTLPSINMVMWNLESKWALVIFNDAIEPELMKDASRWSFNRERNILRGPIGSAGDNMALLPLTNQAIGHYSLREALTIGFTEKNGIIEYIVSRGGGMVRDVQTECNCEGLGFRWDKDHKELEAGAEMYAFAYTFFNPGGCDAKMEWSAWTRTPVGHDNYRNEFATNEDYRLEGMPVTGNPGDPYPDMFSMDLDDSGVTHTLPFYRMYRHNITISVWADCTSGYRPGTNPPDPHETFVTTKTFILGPASSSSPEGFDCVNPVFDVEPVVLYGDEAADMITGLMEGIPFFDQGASGTWYCGSMNRFGYDGFEARMADLHDNYSCDLFVVAKASDPIDGNRYGNMDLQHMVLDMKHERPIDPYVYGDSGGGACLGIGLDHYPWAGTEIDPADREIVSDWPDKGYKQSDEGMWHDWNGGESSIMYWNLSEILRQTANEDVTDIRVRIVDNNQIPGSDVEGNWRRSGNVLEQLNVAPIEVKARFVGDNPYDEYEENSIWKDDLNWKIVKYDATEITNHQIETTYIYNRSNDGTADGEVLVHYYILVDTEENPIHPLEPIPVLFSSSETKFPNGCADTVSLNAYPSDGSEIPGGLTRLNELFQPQSECPKYYHVSVTISDNRNTSYLNSVLYISSRDHLLDGDDKLDYTTSQSSDVLFKSKLDNFSFGKYRGQGRETPDILKKQWYSYDEFITNGGIEVLNANVEASSFTIPQADEAYQFVPVQSESDVIIVNAHGGYYQSYVVPTPPVTQDYIVTQSFTPPPIYTVDVKPLKWHSNAYRFCVNNIDSNLCFSGQYCSDFSLEPEAGWGDFWRKDNDGELRWLVMYCCHSVEKTPTPQSGNFDLRKNWREIILSNYISSVCGFRWTESGSKPFTTIYGDYLLRLYEQVGGYDPGTQVCLPGHDYYYKLDPNDDWRANASMDLSVAAWMEAAAWGFNNLYAGRIRYRGEWASSGIWAASAINDEFPNEFYYFYLKPTRSKGSDENNNSHYINHKILKEYFE